ncbi:MAG: H-type lectin domain-containing protein [Cyanobacteria bacterium P01_G01_bin.39]
MEWESVLPWIGAISPILISLGGIIAFNRQQATHANEIRNLNEKITKTDIRIDNIKSPDKTIVEEIREFLKLIEDKRQILTTEISEIQKKINHANSIIKKTRSQITFFEMEVVQADRDFLEFAPKLEKLMNKQNDFDMANQFLDSLSEHRLDINIHNKLESLDQKIKDNHFGNYQDLIKLDRSRLNESDFVRVEGGNDNQREAKKRIDFNHEYKQIPKVFVAIAKIDAITELYSKETGTVINSVAYAKSLQSRYVRLEVDTKHVDNQGFTVVALTWNDSIVFSVDIVWIVFGS